MLGTDSAMLKVNETKQNMKRGNKAQIAAKATNKIISLIIVMV